LFGSIDFGQSRLAQTISENHSNRILLAASLQVPSWVPLTYNHGVQDTALSKRSFVGFSWIYLHTPNFTTADPSVLSATGRAHKPLSDREQN